MSVREAVGATLLAEDTCDLRACYPCDGSHGRACTEPWRADRPAPTVTTTEVKGTRAHAPSWSFHGGPDRASDAAFLVAGVRRIEAVTEAGALTWLDGRDAVLVQAADLLKVAPEQLGERVARLIEDNRKAERDITALRRKLAAGGGGAGDGPAVVNGINFVGRLLEDTPARELKSMADEIKMSLTNGVICLVATDNGKASIVVAVTADLADQQNAVDLVKAGSAALGGGGGGGRPDMAQAGGPNADAATAAIEAVSAALG